MKLLGSIIISVFVAQLLLFSTVETCGAKLVISGRSTISQTEKSLVAPNYRRGFGSEDSTDFDD